MTGDIFEVGLPVSIETHYKYYLTTNLIGWERDLFLITGIISSAGKGQLKINDPCRMRLLKNGIAYGFETQIISVSLKPYPVMYFQYPTTIEQFTMRKFKRFESNVHARLLDHHDQFITDATITDISLGGCGLNIPLDVKELAYEDNYKLEFKILEKEMHLCCYVRKMTIDRATRFLGIEFCKITSEEMATIDSYLDILTDISSSRIDLILSKLKTSGATLGGHIEDLPLMDILQMLDQSKKEGILNITSDQRSGFISISNSMVMDVSMDGMKGEDALVELLSLKKGEFNFYAKEVTSGYINRPMSFILMDTCRIMDERDYIREYIPDQKDQLTLMKEPDSDDPEILAITNAIRSGASTSDKIKTATRLPSIRSDLVMAKLIKDGFLMKSN